MTTEHEFARFIRTLGKGPKTARPLTRDDARTAFAMVLAGEATPEQIGAFLCLLRVMGETPDELAGFAQAARALLRLPQAAPPVALDWPSYAGKRRRLPWYLLAALLLSRNGLPVFMHGRTDPAEGRLHAGAALRDLGVTQAASVADAAADLARHGFAYMALEDLCPQLAALMTLRPLLGLRSPVHTMVRMLNPFAAPCQVIGIAHPAYRALHADAAWLLGQPAAAIFKGDGGEAEQRPEKPCQVSGPGGDETWPALLPDARAVADETLDPAPLAVVWQGRASDPVGEAAVLGTVAIVLKAAGRAATQEAAMAQAQSMWAARGRLAVAA